MATTSEHKVERNKKERTEKGIGTIEDDIKQSRMIQSQTRGVGSMPAKLRWKG